MTSEIHVCPSCGSEEVSRNGQNRHGKQNYLCRDCGRQFVDNPTWKAITTEQQGLIDRMLLERSHWLVLLESCKSRKIQSKGTLMQSPKLCHSK